MADDKDKQTETPTEANEDRFSYKDGDLEIVSGAKKPDEDGKEANKKNDEDEHQS